MTEDMSMREFDEDREESGEILPNLKLAQGLKEFGKSLLDNDDKPTSSRDVNIEEQLKFGKFDKLRGKTQDGKIRRDAPQNVSDRSSDLQSLQISKISYDRRENNDEPFKDIIKNNI